VDRQTDLRVRVIERVGSALEADGRVDALWLGGSLDAAKATRSAMSTSSSVAASGHVDDLVQDAHASSRSQVPSSRQPGPRTRPSRAAQFNALYDTHPVCNQCRLETSGRRSRHARATCARCSERDPSHFVTTAPSASARPGGARSGRLLADVITTSVPSWCDRCQARREGDFDGVDAASAICACRRWKGRRFDLLITLLRQSFASSLDRILAAVSCMERYLDVYRRASWRTND